MTSKIIAGTATVFLAATGTQADAELLFAPGEDEQFSWESFEAYSASHDLSGQEVSVVAPWTGEDAALFRNVLAYFEAATGAVVNYSGTTNFEDDIVISVNAGSPPNVAIFPQPGLAADLAAAGHLAPLGEALAEAVQADYAAGSSWTALGSFPGPDGEAALFGVFYKVDLKSLVWYVPEVFEEAGYDVPETMEALRALTTQIVEDGGTPWCIGLASGAATGWPATDWVEDLVLRSVSPETYDAWTTGDLAFASPDVVAAVEDFGWFARTPEHTVGGPRAVAGTDFRDSVGGLFDFPPDCYMHKQATFIPAFFPDGTELGLDVDFFYFPAWEGRDLGRPVLGAGTLATIAQDSPTARALIEFLMTPIAHEVWMAQSGFLSPHLHANSAVYANDTLREQGRILAEATVFRFDGSDLMPSEVGTNAFWTAMVDYVTGDDATEVLQRIDETWARIP